MRYLSRCLRSKGTSARLFSLLGRGEGKKKSSGDGITRTAKGFTNDARTKSSQGSRPSKPKATDSNAQSARFAGSGRLHTHETLSQPDPRPTDSWAGGFFLRRGGARRPGFSRPARGPASP